MSVLSDAERAAIVQCYHNDLTHEEAAAGPGVSGRNGQDAHSSGQGKTEGSGSARGRLTIERGYAEQESRYRRRLARAGAARRGQSSTVRPTWPMTGSRPASCRACRSQRRCRRGVDRSSCSVALCSGSGASGRSRAVRGRLSRHGRDARRSPDRRCRYCCVARRAECRDVGDADLRGEDRVGVARTVGEKKAALARGPDPPPLSRVALRRAIRP